VRRSAFPFDFLVCLLSSFSLLLASSCKDTSRLSKEKATAHVSFLAEAMKKDVEEVRNGLPSGADALAASLKSDATVLTDPKAASRALEEARRKVQDLRIAKSTFFALADANGVVVRNNQEQDRMAGHSLFAAFPALADSKTRYLETSGSMPEASGVRAPRPDGQWVAAAPVRVDGETKGVYATGWSWSAYAYRLEFALRGRIRSELMGKTGEKEPLIYVYMVVGKAAYGAPVSPEVNMKAIADLDPLSKTKGDEVFSTTVDVTGRGFGLAIKRVADAGPDVAVAVLRSET
jgi:hypothetical protein